VGISLFVGYSIGCKTDIMDSDKLKLRGDLMKKTSKFSIILYAICAVIWTIRVILEVVSGTYSDSDFWFVMNVLCALVWIGAFLVNLKRYRSDQAEQ
jgi:hypothetical protein